MTVPASEAKPRHIFSATAAVHPLTREAQIILRTSVLGLPWSKVYVEMAKSNPGDSTELARLDIDLVAKLGTADLTEAGPAIQRMAVNEAFEVQLQAANRMM